MTIKPTTGLALLIDEIIRKANWSIERIAEEADIPDWIIQKITRNEELPEILFIEYINKLKDLKIRYQFLNLKLPPKRIQKNLNSTSSPESKIGKQWSRKFPSCIGCGTTEIKHIARGLCLNCYRLDNEHKQKEHNRERGHASSVISEAYLIELYNKDGLSLRDIAEHFSCSRQYIYKMMKAYKIPLRTKKTARDLALGKGKLIFQKTDEDGIEYPIILKKLEYDRSFFKFWSPEMAWVMGVIYSDGNVFIDTPDYMRLEISQKEPELLLKVKALLRTNAELYYNPKRVSKGIVSGELYRLQIMDLELVNDLLKLGVTPNKSLTVSFPEMPKKCVRHFIRGCWDGDGSVFIQEQGPKIVASFVSGSLKFIEGMLSEFEEAGFEKRKIYVSKLSKHPSYSFKFHSSQCEKLYHYFYHDVPPSQYLERKYMVFRQYFETQKIKPVMAYKKGDLTSIIDYVINKRRSK